MRRGVAPLLLLLSCSAAAPDRDTAACDAFARSTLPRGAALRLVGVARVDGDPMPAASFPAHAGMIRPRGGDAIHDLDRLLWDETQKVYGKSRLALRTMTLTYQDGDARKEQVCAFRLVDGQLESAEQIGRIVERAGRPGTVAGLDVLQGRAAAPRPRFNCCL